MICCHRVTTISPCTHRGFTLLVRGHSSHVPRSIGSYFPPLSLTLRWPRTSRLGGGCAPPPTPLPARPPGCAVRFVLSRGVPDLPDLPLPCPTRSARLRALLVRQPRPQHRAVARSSSNPNAIARRANTATTPSTAFVDVSPPAPAYVEVVQSEHSATRGVLSGSFSRPRAVMSATLTDATVVVAAVAGSVAVVDRSGGGAWTASATNTRGGSSPCGPLDVGA